MDDASPAVFIFPGAGGGAPDFALFREGQNDKTRFEPVSYPGWTIYTAEGFTPDTLIAHLARQVAAKVSAGPIRIIGVSIGAHFGYAVAVQLQKSGREVAGFCAIDAFVIRTAAPQPGWQGRALQRGFQLLRNGRVAELGRFVQSRWWRALLRLAGGVLPILLRRFGRAVRMPRTFEEELNMRLLIRETVQWLGSLDDNPAILKAPAILLRTQSNAADDLAWRRRCARMSIIEIPGEHQTMFDRQNFEALHKAFIASTRDWRSSGIEGDGVGSGTDNGQGYEPVGT